MWQQFQMTYDIEKLLYKMADEELRGAAQACGADGGQGDVAGAAARENRPQGLHELYPQQ